VRRDEDALLLSIDSGAGDRYSNAQITDYDYRTFEFLWRPPLRLSVTAQASHGGDRLRGTAGFGFWNHPFSPDAQVRRTLRLPQAIWFFFGSPPNDMQLAHGVPGSGWKAASIDAGRPAALALIPLALPALLLMQSRTFYDRLYPGIQRALAIDECLLDDQLLAERHTYSLEWRVNGARFTVDERVVLETSAAPRGPCGFVAWLDNQYAVVTPRGRFGAGVMPVEATEWLRLYDIHIET
jgi:hypothetical protein